MERGDLLYRAIGATRSLAAPPGASPAPHHRATTLPSTKPTESDIDLLVLLRGDLDYFQELRTLVDLLFPLQLDAARVISALPAAAEEYRRGTLQLYRNAAREGLAL